MLNILPEIEGIVAEESDGRLKITIPQDRHWVLFGLYSLMLLTWIILFVGIIVYAIRIAFSGERYAAGFSFLLLIFLLILYRLGKTVWKQWQYYAANREILFLDEALLIVRRPVSLAGLTDAYDMKHISHFYYSERYHTPAFEYGQRKVFFAQDLEKARSKQLISYLNGRYFPNFDDEAEED